MPKMNTYPASASIDDTDVFVKEEADGTRTEKVTAAQLAEYAKSKGANVDATLTQAGVPADAKAAGDGIAELKSAITIEYKDITTSDLESGVWNWSVKGNNAARARTKSLIPVKVGMNIIYTVSTYDVFFGVLETDSSRDYIQTIGWKTSSGSVKITSNGYLTFNIRNHSDTTATVDPVSWDGTTVIYDYPAQEIPNIREELYAGREVDKLTVSAKYTPTGNTFSPTDMPFNTWWAGAFSTVKTALTTGTFSGFPLSANDSDTIRIEKYEQIGGQTALYIFRLAGESCKCVTNYAGTTYTWTVYATNRNTIIANRITITAANKAQYFTDADNAPENMWFEIQAGAQIVNTPHGNGISSASGVYTDLRSITGYLDGSLYTYRTNGGSLINQIFISSGKHANVKATPNVMYIRTKYTGGLWGDWSKFGGNSTLTASNIAIRKKMIAPYLDGDGNPTATNTGTANPQYMADDPLIFNDFNDAPPMSIYQIDLDCDATVMANNPEPGYSSILITAGFSYVVRHGQVQLCVGVKSSGTFAWIRYGYQQAANDYRWSSWKSIV